MTLAKLGKCPSIRKAPYICAKLRIHWGCEAAARRRDGHNRIASQWWRANALFFALSQNFRVADDIGTCGRKVLLQATTKSFGAYFFPTNPIHGRKRNWCGEERACKVNLERHHYVLKYYVFARLLAEPLENLLDEPCVCIFFVVVVVFYRYLAIVSKSWLNDFGCAGRVRAIARWPEGRPQNFVANKCAAKNFKTKYLDVWKENGRRNIYV